MKKIIHAILALAAVIALWTGCSDEPATPEHPARAIGFFCSDVQSRTQETTAGNMTSFRVSAVWTKAAGDYVPDYMNNQSVEKNGSGDWVYSPVCYIPSYGAVDFFAYSPANATVSDFAISGATHDQVSLSYDVTTDHAKQQDFMVATALEKTSSPIELTFNHMLASVRVGAHITPQSAQQNYWFRVYDVKLMNLQREGILTGTTVNDPYTGKTTTWTWATDPLQAKATYTIAQSGYKDITDPLAPPVSISDNSAGPLMVLPQTVEIGPTVTNPALIGSDAYLVVTYDTFDALNKPISERAITDYIPITDGNGGKLVFESGKRYIILVNFKHPLLTRSGGAPATSLHITAE